MLKMIKDLALSKGAELLQSPAATKILESEKFGMILERAISIPVKVSGVINTHKHNLVSVLDLATQNDVDDLKRNLQRIESALKDIKAQSSELLDQVDDKDTSNTPPIAQ